MAFLFGHIKKMLYICTRNSTPKDVWHQRRRVADIIKGVYYALFWHLETSQLSNFFQDLATIDALRDIDYPSCAYLVRHLRIYYHAHAYFNYDIAREYIYIRRGLRVVGSKKVGNAKASKVWNWQVQVSRFFCVGMKTALTWNKQSNISTTNSVISSCTEL